MRACALGRTAVVRTLFDAGVKPSLEQCQLVIERSTVRHHDDLVALLESYVSKAARTATLVREIHQEWLALDTLQQLHRSIFVGDEALTDIGEAVHKALPRLECDVVAREDGWVAEVDLPLEPSLDFAGALPHYTSEFADSFEQRGTHSVGGALHDPNEA